MIFLIDTNVVIPLEPTSQRDIVSETRLYAHFVRKIQETGQRVMVHPQQMKDIERDTSVARREGRKIRFLAVLGG
jgi:hypothetical protein